MIDSPRNPDDDSPRPAIGADGEGRARQEQLAFERRMAMEQMIANLSPAVSDDETAHRGSRLTTVGRVAFATWVGLVEIELLRYLPQSHNFGHSFLLALSNLGILIVSMTGIRRPTWRLIALGVAVGLVATLGFGYLTGFIGR